MSAVQALTPEHADTVGAYVSETERRYRTLSSRDLMDAMIFDLFALLAINAKSLDRLDTGTLQTIVQVEADRAALALLEAQDKAERRKGWRENWQLILGSGGVGVLLAGGAIKLVEVLLTNQ